jgi:DNA helicase HerA-like ATPase
VELVRVAWMNSNEVRLKEHVGIVTSDTSTVQFSFFVTPLKNKTWLGKEDYVMVDHPVFGELCPLLAVVKEIRNYEEVVGTTVNEKTVETVAAAEILGYVDLRNPETRPLRKSFVPPSPGSKVYLPYLEFLEDVFLRDFDGRRVVHALHVGTLESRATYRNGDAGSLSFCLNAEDFMRQHFLVAGMTGTGKTHAAAVVVEELANKTDLPVVVLDSFGEYVTVGFAGKNFEQFVKAGRVSAKDYVFEFGVSVFAFDPETVKRRLDRFGVSVGKSGRFVAKSFSGKWREFPDEKAVRAVGEELGDVVKRGQVLVVDGAGLGLEERRRLFSCCLSALWGCRVEGSVVPFVLVVDEAESVETALLERVASEGKKLGIMMCLLSQHPAGIGGRVFSQMGAQVMGRMMDAEDLELLKGVAGDDSAVLSKLRTGEWIVNGVGLMRPQKVLVRERYSV